MRAAKAPAAEQAEEDPLKVLADKLRGPKALAWRDAVIADQRVEIFRGKDFVAYLKQHSDLMAGHVSRALRLDQQVKELGELLLRRGLCAKAERMYKRPKPGKRRLVKFPHKLTQLPDKAFTPEGFYAWQYSRPASPYLKLYAALFVALVMMCCLFPLFPHWIKLGVVYITMTLLIIIFVVIFVRSILALVTWVTLGRTLWLFPHMLSEEKGIDEAFWPIYEWEVPEKGRQSHWLLRVAVAALFSASLVFLHSYAPLDQGSVWSGAQSAHDGILEMLNLHEQGLGKLGAGGGAGVAAGGGRGGYSRGSASAPFSVFQGGGGAPSLADDIRRGQAARKAEEAEKARAAAAAAAAGEEAAPPEPGPEGDQPEDWQKSAEELERELAAEEAAAAAAGAGREAAGHEGAGAEL